MSAREPEKTTCLAVQNLILENANFTKWKSEVVPNNTKETDQKPKMYDYEKLISHVGLSPYLIFLIFCTSVQIWPAGLNNMAPMFLMATPDHHVKQHWFEQLEQSNCTEQYQANQWNGSYPIHYAGLARKLDKGNVTDNYDNCKLYTHTDDQLESLLVTAGYNMQVKYDSCDELYDAVDAQSHQFGDYSNTTNGDAYWYGVHKSGMTSTTATDFELVCDRANLATYIKSSYMVGFAVGAMVFGPLSDNKGRKWVMQITSVGAFIADVAIVFSVNWIMFAVARFVAATCISGLYVAAFTYAMEILQPKYRSFTGVNIQAQFAVGYVMLGFMSLVPWFHDWRYFSAAITVVSFLGAAAAFYVPESPAWQFTKGQVDDALITCEDILERKTGEASFPQHVIQEALDNPTSSGDEKTNQVYTMADLFKNKSIAMITLVVMFQWFVNTLTYYGLSFSAGELPGSVVFNNSIGGLMEILSQILLVLLMDRVWCGRKRLLIGLEFIAGSTCLVCAVLYYPSVKHSLLESGMSEDNLSLMIQMFAQVGKFGIAGSFALIYNYTAELYPVVIRANGVSLGSISGRVGGVLFPFVLDLQNNFTEGGMWLPMAIFGGLAIVAMVLAFVFPETNGAPNMTTIDEAILFYKGELDTDSDGESEKFLH